MFRFWPHDVTPQQCGGCGSELCTLRSRPIRVHAVSGAPRLTPLTESPARSLETRFPGDILRGRCCVFGVSHGPPRQLEGFFAPFARDLPGRVVSGDVGYRKGQLQPGQPQNRPPSRRSRAGRTAATLTATPRSRRRSSPKPRAGRCSSSGRAKRSLCGRRRGRRRSSR